MRRGIQRILRKNAIRSLKNELDLAPSYCACDSHAKGQKCYDILFSHPSGKQMTDKRGRPTFTREWGDCVDDWSSHNSPSRVNRSWGELPQLDQTQHYQDSRDPKHRVTSLTQLLAQPAYHFGGCLWHSFDHARGYHLDMFYGGIMTSARIPKLSYWMFKAVLASRDQKFLMLI